MLKSNLQKEEVLCGCSLRKVVCDGRGRHGEQRDHINSKHKWENKVGGGSEKSKPTISVVFPSARMHSLPKQHQQLGTKYSSA